MEESFKIKVKGVLQECRPYINNANYNAEARYDSLNADIYMDAAQYEIMEETKKLVKKIDDLLLFL